MHTLIVKLDASGDVVRTTPLLHVLQGEVTWLTSERNVELLQGLSPRLRCVAWPERHLLAGMRPDLVINLEDEAQACEAAQQAGGRDYFGACLSRTGEMAYTDSARGWFDMGLISRHGRSRADALKLLNRRSYQDLLFEGLGYHFDGQRYRLPTVEASELSGDVAIAPRAGPVWPMKGWAHYEALRSRLESDGLTVNVLPQRPTLREHIADVLQHRCLVSGDSLPMHIALGAGVPCVTLFNCTSPWEIHDYGLQTQIVSPLLTEFFYRRGHDERAIRAIPVEAVHQAILDALQRTSPAAALAR